MVLVGAVLAVEQLRGNDDGSVTVEQFDVHRHQREVARRHAGHSGGGNLDPQTSVEVMKVLQEINKSGRTILMATHDYALLLKHPSRTLKCEDGRVFEVVHKKPEA